MAGRHSHKQHPSLPAIAGLAAAGAVLLVALLLAVTSGGGARHARATLSRPREPRVHVYTAPTVTYPPAPAPPPPTTTTVPAPAPTPLPADQPIPQHLPTARAPGALTARCRDGTISTTGHGPLCYQHGGIRYTL